MRATRWIAHGALVVTALAMAIHPAAAQTIETLSLRGQPQQLRVYGTRGAGDPVLLSSGDGGWMHLAPQVAVMLAARGFFVVGFDTKEYLRGFTSGGATLRPEDEPGDYRTLAEFAARGGSKKALLIGVSEGAALSALAAADRATQPAIAGVIGLGLSDRNELGWRWKDSVIYLTHGVPNEPTFSVAAIVDKLAPIPLAEIHSTRDEFSPLTDAQVLIGKASPPKRLWVVEASDHRFSGGLAAFERSLFEAIAWVAQNRRQ